MITILYLILTYLLLGSVVYLIAQSQGDNELTPFKRELFLFLGAFFKIVITIILIIDGYIIPKIKQKKAIRFVNKQYNKQLRNKSLTSEQRQEIIDKRDAMIEFINNVGNECDYDEE